MAYIETLLTSIAMVLKNIGPALSLIMVMLSGIIYAMAQTQPADTRGKWISWAINLFVGGIIIAAVVGSAELITSTAEKLGS